MSFARTNDVGICVNKNNITDHHGIERLYQPFVYLYKYMGIQHTYLFTIKICIVLYDCLLHPQQGSLGPRSLRLCHYVDSSSKHHTADRPCKLW